MLDWQDVHRFWFEEHGENDWFSGAADFDARLASQFAETHAAVARGEGWTWRQSARGRVAEIVVLDQFSRQLHRGNAHAFAQDGMALVLAQELVGQGLDAALDPAERIFAYMPYMHSESLKVHDEAVRLFTALGNESTLDYELKHREVIARFGRYPFRNAARGLTSTPEEAAHIAAHADRGF